MKSVFNIHKLILTVLFAIALVSCDEISNFGISKPVKDKIQSVSEFQGEGKIGGRPLVMIIKDKSDSAGSVIAYNIKWALLYTKIPFKVVGVSNIRNLKIPASVKVICYTPTTSDHITDATVVKFIRFVAKGHSLIFSSPLWNPRMAFLQGMKPVTDDSINKKASGYHFLSSALPGFKNRTVLGPGFGKHFGFQRENFLKGIKILATAGNDTTYPAILEHKIGEGNVILFNTSTLATREYRGLLFSSIIKGLPGVPYLTANIGTIFIDDFPQPLYNDIRPPVKKEYGLTDAQFETKIWWPDMKKLADEFHFKYSCMMVFNYNNEITPPFDFIQWNYASVKINGHIVDASPWLLRQARKQGYEIGYHGYNHISLMKKDWRTEHNMVNSIQAARKEWVLQHAGSFPVTYVAPNDFIDSLGIQSLIKGMPSIKYLCTTFDDSVKNGNGREFNPDPYANKLFDYPRITSGYTDNNVSLFNEENVYIFSGIWTHFVHPDDIYDLPRYGGEGVFNARNIHGLGWHPFGKHKLGLFEVFQNRLKQSFEINPLLRIKPARNAVPVVERWRSSKVTRISKPLISEIQYRNYAGRPDTTLKYWYVFVPKSKDGIYNKLINDQSVHFAKVGLWDGYLYEFKTNRNTLFFPKMSSNAELNRNYGKSIADSAVTAFLSYRTSRDALYDREEEKINMVPLLKAEKALQKNPNSVVLQDEVIKLGAALNRLDISIELLRRRLLSNRIWRKQDIVLLMRYYSWQNKNNAIWPFLNERWKRYPDIETIRLENYIVGKLGTPNDQFNKTWLLRAIRLEPHNYKLKSNFAYDFQSGQDWSISKKYLLQLIRHYPQSDTLYRYTFRRSTWYDKPDTTLKLLASFPQSAYGQLAPFSSQIADLYAYNANDLTKAIQWAEKDPGYEQKTILNWLLDQKRYSSFKNRSDELLKNHPDNDSLRTFVGLSYLDNGYNDLAFKTLYPLFKRHKTSPDLKKRMTNTILNLSYDQQKKLYARYPDFFPQGSLQSLIYKHRIEEGVAPGISVSYSTDNFKNTLASSVLSTSWGDRLKYSNTVSAGYYYVSSDINKHLLNNNLQEINYAYTRYFNDQNSQLNIGGGAALLPNSSVLPNISGGYMTNSKISYTSISAQFSPVYTNVAVRKRYSKVNATLYNEFYFFKRHLGTSQAVITNRYSNDVYSWELDGHIYYVPNPRFYFNVKPEIMYSYSSATRNYSSGIPYWTPHDLQIEGIGFMWTYNKEVLIPKFTMDGEMLLNHDNKNGLYLSSNVSLNMKVLKYLQLSIKGDVSTSKVYRSDAVTLSLSYYLPSKIH